MAIKSVRVDKKDYLRALLTDTAPTDVPIIFSNDGFYLNSHRAKSMDTNDLDVLVRTFFMNFLDYSLNSNLSPDTKRRKQDAPTVAYKYKIPKNEISTRVLSLVHPRSQFNYARFYKDFGDAILVHCRKSLSSLRAPEKITASFFSKNKDFSNKFKSGDIDTLENELDRKHASSYFTYRGHGRKYKFFNDKFFLKLEMQFPFLWTLDVNNCFNSIYTHTIAWAVYTKELAKETIDKKNTFGSQFDSLMQRSNNNETNGIPIGSEVSRVFAEIILQRVDVNIINSLLQKRNLQFNREYTFFRYVDDFLVFAHSEEICKTVASEISESLSHYNLSLNELKIQKHLRPFFTTKSNVISGLQRIIFELEEKVFGPSNVSGKIPRADLNVNKLNFWFIEMVKRQCSISACQYSDVSSYLVAVLSNRVIELVRLHNSWHKANIDSQNEYFDLERCLNLFLELAFFFFSVAPSITASQSLAKCILILDQYLGNYSKEIQKTLRTKISLATSQIFSTGTIDLKKASCLPIEHLNLIISTSGFGPNFTIDPLLFEVFFQEGRKIDYFEAISLLFYFKNNPEYLPLITRLEKKLISKFDLEFDLKKDAETAFIFLDFLSCPYLSSLFRVNLLTRFYKNFTLPIPAPTELSKQAENLLNTFWFVKWKGLDLIKLLERKKLQNTY